MILSIEALEPVLLSMKLLRNLLNVDKMKILTTILDGNVSCQCYREKSESKKDTKHFLEKISSTNVHFCPSSFGLPMGANFHKHGRGCKGMQAVYV